MSVDRCYPDKAPQVNQLLEVLSHHLRRELIMYFESQPDTVTAPFEDVVTQLVNRVPGETRESVAIELHHTHLPKLAEQGWLRYNSRNREIQYQGHDRAKRWLEQVVDVF